MISHGMIAPLGESPSVHTGQHKKAPCVNMGQAPTQGCHLYCTTNPPKESKMKLVSFALGCVLGYALGTGAAFAGIATIATFSAPIFCALALGAVLAIIV